MKLKNKKIIWNKKIITIALSALFLVIIGGVSYAYFAAIVSGNEEAKDVQTYAGTMNLVYNGTFATSAEKMMPGDSHEIQFTVTNTGTLSTSYQVDMIDIINDFEKPEELVYSITSDNGGGQQEETEVPIVNSTLIPAVGIDPGVTQNYTLKLKFKETGTDQNYNQNKTFSGKVQINSLENSNYLASRVLINQIKNDADLTNEIKIGRYQKTTQEYNPNSLLLKSSLYGNVYIASSYTFDENIGQYFLNNPTISALEEDAIGKYMCYTSVSMQYKNCLGVVKITEVSTVSNSDNINYYENITKQNATFSLPSDNNVVIAANYIFDPKTRGYTLVNPIENATFNQDYIGYYFCSPSANTDKCSSLRKIKAVEDSTVTLVDVYSSKSYKVEYTDGVDYTSPLTSVGNETIGSGYTFDKTTGLFTLTGTIENINSYLPEHEGYYTCFSSENTCDYMVYIKKVEDNKITIWNDYTYLDNGYNYVKKGVSYNSKDTTTDKTNDKGIFETEDDLGTSYYYRGQVDNNYVSFANNIWRITRINGDGSIRLIKNDKLTSMAFNSTTEIDPKYVGYTYDNSAPNVQDGTSSKIKTYLDNWYNSQLTSYNDKIVSGIYCNDTTSTNVDDVTTEYETKKRLENYSPTLQCPETDKTYGGKYNLNIGLLSADEMYFADLNDATQNNYLFKASSWWSMSPYIYDDTNIKMFDGYYKSINNIGVSSTADVYPVINLRKDIKFTSGDGTKNNPYIIQ